LVVVESVFPPPPSEGAGVAGWKKRWWRKVGSLGRRLKASVDGGRGARRRSRRREGRRKKEEERRRDSPRRR
jgi:hypothetical protein